MHKCLIWLTAIAFLAAGCNGRARSKTQDGPPVSVFTSFVTVDGDQLVDENGPLRFISFNIPCLHYNEDNLPFDETNPWRFPDEFEIRDALESVRQMGGQVVRIYTLSVRKPDDDPAVPRHVLGPGQFNEEAFIALDKVLQIANEKGIRIILPFVNNWQWWGGIAEYAAFRGKDKEAFWTDPQLFEDFKRTVAHVINRQNTFTGQYYKDDKAILGWQPGNELECPHEWTVKAAAYIKSLDRNHLVIDPFFTETVRRESIDAPEIDVLTSHHYSPDPDLTIQQIQQNKILSKGKKPYFVGEFGFLPTADIRRILDTVIQTQTAGALLWSLRKHNRDGGFYWHSEPSGGDLYKAYHWPGFDSGSPYDEKQVLNLMRTKAFQIRGTATPALARPAPPVLLPITDAAAIRWQGSAGAATYTIQRAEQPNGIWTTIAGGVDDAQVQYRPLYHDQSAVPGRSYYYRITAHNAAGSSKPSNIEGPVFVCHRTLVDKMADYAQIERRMGHLSLESQQARKFKEDIHRLKGGRNASIVYHLPVPISQWKVYAFYENEIAPLRFSVSSDDQTYQDIDTDTLEYYTGQGSYGYYKPVEYQGRCDGLDAQFLKITFTGPAQLSRVEIAYDSLTSKISSPVGFIMGFSWGWTGWRGQYEGPAPADSMHKLAQTNANWICLAFGAEMETFDSPHILWSETNPKMVSDDEIRGAIQLARENGLKIILKPVVNVRDDTWRAWIKFDRRDGTKDVQAWDTWWADFTAMLLHYARLAQETGCELLCLGCEMESTEDFENRWRDLIRRVRNVYTGPITYNANHGREDKITWWDAVDVISLSAYYPVGTDDVEAALADDLRQVPASDSSVSAIKKRWQPIKNKLAALSCRHQRPILFIELGVCSAKGFSAAPWTHYQPNAVYDGDEQRRYYQATLESFWDEPWFMGFTWWAWPPHLYSQEDAGNHTGFCIYGKPAEALVSEWYAKNR